ncbi:MAG: ATP-binding protein [Bacteroidota bacterium]|nr:ATP-binding protein [Bacteroidota bacterium]
MGLLTNISIHRKLILMQVLTAFVVIILCSVTFFVIDYKSMCENKNKSLLSIAKVIGTNSVAPLLFNDRESSEEILSDLKVETNITNACVMDTSGIVLANYIRADGQNFAFKVNTKKAELSEFTDNDLFIYYKIVHEKEWIGTVCLKAELSDIKDQLMAKIKIGMLVILVGFIFAFILSAFLQKYISKPIIKLVNVMENVIKTRNYSIRSTHHGKDEISKLSDAFNKMLVQIERHDQALSETNNLLEARVKERTQELVEKNEKLFAANTLAEQSKLAKEQFLASMSHEIRTPLNAIIGFQSLLKETPLNEEQKEYVESIDFAGRNLLVIINDILDLSKIEAGKFEFTEDDLNINQIIESTLELLEYRAREKAIELIFMPDEKIPLSLVGDAARFNQILLNLVGNAIKFTEKGNVTVTTKLIESTESDVLCEFAISDTGIGIPQDKLKLIFERFTQASTETTRKYGGTGLGLTIVQQLLNLQGGKIEVSSKVGEGSIFKFFLRFKKAGAKIFTPITYLKQPTEYINKENSMNHKILLAEDTPLNQRLIRKVTQKWGDDLEIAMNGIEAIEKLKAGEYDIILMDIQMPEMDGYTATQVIRALEDPIKKNIPIIALTAHASKEEAERCLSIGMNAYISKPFNSDFLRETIIQLTSNTMLKEQTELKNIVTDLTGLYDLTYLKEHAEGDSAFLAEMIGIFLTDTPRLLEELKSDIDSNDYKKIKITSHSMKGLFLTLGINDAAASLKEIEKMALDISPIELIKSNFQKVETTFQKCREPLTKELEKIKSAE